VAVTDELTRFAEQCTTKSKGFFEAARAALAKSVSLKEEAGTLTGDARKLRKSEIKNLRSVAAGLIVKAQDAALAACSGGNDTTIELRKAIDTALEADPILKAKAESFREKMKEKDEKACSKKALKKSFKKLMAKAEARVAAKAAAKTGAGEAVKTKMQADKQDPETKNQDDESVKKSAEAARLQEAGDMLQKALEGNAVLTATVKQVMEVIHGRPITDNATKPLALVKSGEKEPDALDVLGKVEMAIQNGALTRNEAMRARDLAGKYTAVQTGALSKSIFDATVAKCSVNIQELFAAA